MSWRGPAGSVDFAPACAGPCYAEPSPTSADLRESPGFPSYSLFRGLPRAGLRRWRQRNFYRVQFSDRKGLAQLFLSEFSTAIGCPQVGVFVPSPSAVVHTVIHSCG